MSAPAVVRIEPRRGIRLAELGELWSHRELIWVLATRDVRVRYRQTVLGVAWAVLRPILAAALMTLVFGRLARLPSDGLPYALFALLGVVPWTFFSGAVASASESLLGAQALVTRVYFPRLALPLAALGAPLVDLAVSLVLALGFALSSGLRPSATWTLVPVGLAILFLAAAGLGAGLAALNALFRDVRHLVPFALQLALYASPVVYPASLVPERYRAAYFLNPVAGALEAFRGGVAGSPPDPALLAISGASALALLIAGVTLFLRVERRLADVV